MAKLPCAKGGLFLQVLYRDQLAKAIEKKDIQNQESISGNRNQAGLWSFTQT